MLLGWYRGGAGTGAVLAAADWLLLLGLETVDFCWVTGGFVADLSGVLLGYGLWAGFWAGISAVVLTEAAVASGVGAGSVVEEGTAGVKASVE